MTYVELAQELARLQSEIEIFEPALGAPVRHDDPKIARLVELAKSVAAERSFPESC